ncbi:gamma-aminobutyric acid type B receptor subunit 1-like [Halichondria panicea]|uniref:gamma-aminobutyric acid type B receptor subunit 1-like n=1 Tax=Halichondria panicea TaxID=6063 RepID=UPI00312B9BFF
MQINNDNFAHAFHTREECVRKTKVMQLLNLELGCLVLAFQCGSVLLAPLYIATFFQNWQENSTRWDQQTAMLTRAALIAVNHINNRHDLLPGYKLSLIQGDSGCLFTDRAIVSYVQNVVYPRPREDLIAGMVGPLCSDSVRILSSLVNRQEMSIPQIHLSMLSTFHNRDMYANSFGILGSIILLIDSVTSLVDTQNWYTLLLYEDENKSFQEAIEQLDTSMFTSERVREGFVRLDPLRSRVVIILAGGPLVCEILREAVKNKMVYPAFQWIVMGLEYEQLLLSDGCFVGDVLDKLLFVTFNVDTAFKTDTDACGDDEDLKEIRKTRNNNFSHVSLVYDSIWALAFASNLSLPLHDNSTRGNEHLTSLVTSNLAEKTFKGISGFISFDSSTGYNKRRVDINQISNETVKLIGYFSGGSLTLINNSELINTSKGTQLESVRVEVAVLLTLATVVQLFIIITLHILTVVYRKHTSIRASNPKLSHCIFIGCYVLVTTLILFLWPLKTIVMLKGKVEFCEIFNFWLFPIGITLIFAPLIAHIWRLYRIFTHFRNPGCCISNSALCLIIAVQIAVDLTIAILGTTLTPTFITRTNTGRISTEGKVIMSTMCKQNSPVLLLLMWVYKFIQASTLLGLSCLTKNIKLNRNFTTTRFKFASYLMIVATSVLLPLYLILWITNADIHGDVVVMCILANCFFLLCILFILLPPIAEVFKAKKRANNYSSGVLL